MKFRKIYKKIDIFAKPVPLNIGGHEHFKTGTGASLTLLYLAAILAITVQQFIAYFDKENPTTSIQGYSTEHYPQIDLFKEKLIPFFIGSITDTEYLPVEDINKYVTLRSHRLSWVTNELGNGVIDVAKLTKPFTVVPCKSLVGEERELFSYVKEDSTFHEIFMNFGMCPKICESLTIEGKGVDDFMEEFIFNVNPVLIPTVTCVLQRIKWISLALCLSFLPLVSTLLTSKSHILKLAMRTICFIWPLRSNSI
jgi:hypothetical protein